MSEGGLVAQCDQRPALSEEGVPELLEGLRAGGCAGSCLLPQRIFLPDPTRGDQDLVCGSRARHASHQRASMCLPEPQSHHSVFSELPLGLELDLPGGPACQEGHFVPGPSLLSPLPGPPVNLAFVSLPPGALGAWAELSRWHEKQNYPGWL